VRLHFLFSFFGEEAIFMGVYILIGLNFEQTIWDKTKVKLGTSWEHDENTLGRRKQKNPIQKFLDKCILVYHLLVSQNP
jgi:hypothetical protein